MQIGARVRHIRKERKMTLGELSAKTGIDAASLSKLERGQKKFYIDFLELIGKALEVPIQEFLGHGEVAQSNTDSWALFARRESQRTLSPFGDWQHCSFSAWAQVAYSRVCNQDIHRSAATTGVPVWAAGHKTRRICPPCPNIGVLRKWQCAARDSRREAMSDMTHGERQFCWILVIAAILFVGLKVLDGFFS
jgi:transcriptional regulator with XRE-family HTH domain